MTHRWRAEEIIHSVLLFLEIYLVAKKKIVQKCVSIVISVIIALFLEILTHCTYTSKADDENKNT